MKPRYFSDESRMQSEAIEWLRREWGYYEVVSAEEDGPAWGAPIDSVGQIDDRIYLIEFKNKIDASIIYNNDNSTSSIENKIGRTLAGIISNDMRYNFPRIREIWDRKNPLIFVALAEQFSEGACRNFESLLSKKSPEWLFEGRLWQWNGREVQQIFQSSRSVAPYNGDFSKIIISRDCSLGTRRRSKSIEELRSIAAKSGLVEIFSDSVLKARTLGFTINPTGSGVNLLYKGNNRHKRETSISMHVTKSSAEFGMIFSFMSERNDIDWDCLPGSDAPKTGRYPVPNRYIRTKEEAGQALSLFVR